MSAIPERKFTIEEYIEFDKNNEGRWEYFGGEVFDMAGGSVSHNRISRNLIGIFDRKLEGESCEAFAEGMRIKVPKALPYRYPDVVVVCGEMIIEKIQAHGSREFFAILKIEICSWNGYKDQRCPRTS